MTPSPKPDTPDKPFIKDGLPPEPTPTTRHEGRPCGTELPCTSSTTVDEQSLARSTGTPNPLSRPPTDDLSIAIDLGAHLDAPCASTGPLAGERGPARPFRRPSDNPANGHFGNRRDRHLRPHLVLVRVQRRRADCLDIVRLSVANDPAGAPSRLGASHHG